MQVKINVTQNDINKGVHSDCHKCPIARAMLRAGFPAVNVFGCTFQLGRKYTSDVTSQLVKLSDSFPLPGEAEKFINKFDSGKKVKPFKFAVEVPYKVLRSVGFKGKAVKAVAAKK